MRRFQPVLIARCLASLALMLGWVTPADAHLNASGVGPLYDGISHFVLSPDDVAAVLALALLAGLLGASYGRKALFVLPAAWFCGGLGGLVVSAWTGNSLVSAASLLLCGVLLATRASPSLWLFVLIAALLGFWRGYANTAGMVANATILVALVGISVAVFVTVALTSAFAVGLQTQWARIAVRVAGSWIAATGLLMVGWALRTGSALKH